MGSVAYSCEHRKELLRYAKDGKCINLVRNYCCQKKSFNPYSLLDILIPLLLNILEMKMWVNKIRLYIFQIYIQ
jgi:hypothetical protein